MWTVNPRQSGYALLESLVALAVVVVGVLGVAKLNAVMLGGTGLSKTRAEAVQIAQQRIEAIRNFQIGASCDQPPAGLPDSVTGVNAQYAVSIGFSNAMPAAPAAPQRVNVQVCVAWNNDGTAPCSAPADRRVILTSVVGCSGVGTSGLIGGSATATTGGFVKTPTGAARVGGNTYDPGAVPGTANTITIDGLSQSDGTKIHVNSDGERELIDATTGKVLLTVANGTEFSTITGKVYIEAKNGSPIVNPGGANPSITSDDNVFVLSSDASYCARYIPATLPVVPAGATGSSIKYFYFYYKCYIGKGWWGNIGVVRTDNANANDRVCVGDSLQANDGTLWSKHPQRSTNRAYRGYRDIGGGLYETTGIGIGPDGTTYTVKHYPDPSSAKHDFLIANITGNQSCASDMQLATPTLPFTGNQGKYFCLSSTCPGLTSVPATPTTVIRGTITRVDGAALSGIDTANGACKAGSIAWEANGTESYSYSCTLDWTGFTAASWYGAVNFTPVGTASLCAAGATTTVLPAGTAVTYTIHDAAATTDPNSLAFTDVPLAVTDVQIDFSVHAGACGLGVPSLSWTGADPKSLSWPAISGATGYKVYRCSTSNNSSLTACTPTTLVSTITTTSYAPGDPANKETICVNVKSTNGTSDSTASATKCIYRLGGYTYQ